jgi:hypothetical protein
LPSLVASHVAKFIENHGFHWASLVPNVASCQLVEAGSP